VPALVAAGGVGAAKRFVEFFTANIRNRSTRGAYARAVVEFFRWCEMRGVGGYRED
jgi:integrase/recombinase XerD